MIFPKFTGTRNGSAFAFLLRKFLDAIKRTKWERRKEKKSPDKRA